MAVCSDLIAGIALTCNADNKVSGVKRSVWIGKQSEVASYTVDGTSKEIQTIVMEEITTGVFGKLLKFKTKKDKIFANYPVTAGENVNTFAQSVNLPLYHFSQLERTYIEALVNADELVLILQTNAAQFEVYGLGRGLTCTAGEGGTGTLLNDPNAFVVTLSGEEMKMPQIFNISGGTEAANAAYLDGKDGSAA